MKDNSLESIFNSYFNNKKDFSDFHTLITEDEASLIPLSKNKVELYQCSARLKVIHTFLSRFVFNEMPMRKDIVFSYQKDVNISDAVRPHCNSEFIFKTDISKFFPSISAEAVSHTLSKYCENIRTVDPEEVRENIKRIVYLCTVNNRLPVGFSCSPSISNFCFYDYDNTIEAYCNEKGYIYSRYSDDLIISSQDEMDKKIITSDLTAMLSSDAFLKLSLNHKKTKIITKKYERKILGISILNDGKMTVSKATKTDIEVKLHLLKTDRKKLLNYTGMDEMTSILSIAGVLSQINNIDQDYLFHLRKKYGNAIISKLLRGKELLK
ncbi:MULTISPECIES: reverse transcriptase domain-containing protein [Pectobacterium]|uniref:RNA-directed DNA polymerase n=1 Tax=Pectobacterium aquaticum TaxID=2204145 RepID=A0A3R8PDS7_9GAMM|nr:MULTISPECIES: reverse transcriptase domain-containing protein [Pectobacterium]MCH5052029.1 RNA-directed DNA polymerase [Pectobacterium aquaticum]RRN94664.1 RNA-directed DNA polymerase [Pectobacterium aquaticum]RRO02548.1 RNA-directed DNA polymerase [Pectobacterium aquaticum]RRO05175.1 RNA-directed DNA polymerase [Pectobacterium aquaticum]UCP81240.1 reverse transcriptase family protein [Pectobacterium versatile]